MLQLVSIAVTDLSHQDAVAMFDPDDLSYLDQDGDEDMESRVREVSAEERAARRPIVEEPTQVSCVSSHSSWIPLIMTTRTSSSNRGEALFLSIGQGGRRAKLRRAQPALRDAIPEDLPPLLDMARRPEVVRSGLDGTHRLRSPLPSRKRRACCLLQYPADATSSGNRV